jgi:hypothetical protein
MDAPALRPSAPLLTRRRPNPNRGMASDPSGTGTGVEGGGLLGRDALMPAYAPPLNPASTANGSIPLLPTATPPPARGSPRLAHRIMDGARDPMVGRAGGSAAWGGLSIACGTTEVRVSPRLAMPGRTGVVGAAADAGGSSMPTPATRSSWWWAPVTRRRRVPLAPDAMCTGGGDRRPPVVGVCSTGWPSVITVSERIGGAGRRGRGAAVAGASAGAGAGT